VPFAAFRVSASANTLGTWGLRTHAFSDTPPSIVLSRRRTACISSVPTVAKGWRSAPGQLRAFEANERFCASQRRTANLEHVDIVGEADPDANSETAQNGDRG